MTPMSRSPLTLHSQRNQTSFSLLCFNNMPDQFLSKFAVVLVRELSKVGILLHIPDIEELLYIFGNLLHGRIFGQGRLLHGIVRLCGWRCCFSRFGCFDRLGVRLEDDSFTLRFSSWQK